MSGIGVKLGLFTVAMIALGGLLMYPASIWGGEIGRMSLLAAWCLAVVPGWGVLASQGFARTPQMGVFVALGSTVGRLLFVGFGVLVILNLRVLPELQFAVWVVVCYLAALVAETALALPGKPSVRVGTGFAAILRGGGR
jgi:hypothetical protein